MPLDQKKLESHLTSMEAAAKLMLNEAKKVRAMIDLPESPERIDTTRMKFYQRVQRSLNKKPAATTTGY